MPTISIVMPAYRAERTIGESVNSVITQTYKDWELIIVADDTASAEAVPKDERTTVIGNEPNLGLSKSRNKGVEAARGEWIAFLDADDVWDSEKLERQLDFMKKRVQTYPAHQVDFLAVTILCGFLRRLTIRIY